MVVAAVAEQLSVVRLAVRLLIEPSVCPSAVAAVPLRPVAWVFVGRAIAVAAATFAGWDHWE